MIRILSALLVLFWAVAASAQSVQQSGTVTPGHAAQWVAPGVIKDGGTAANGSLSSLGVTQNGAGICQNSALVTSGGYQQICLGTTTLGGGVISVQNYGTATAQGLSFSINGTIVTIPTGGSTIPTINLPVTDQSIICADGTNGVIKGCFNTVPIASGGTNATTAAGARTNLGLGTISLQDASAVAITGGTITGLPTPSAASDATPKSYVDGVAQGLNIHTPVRLASAAVLPNTPSYGNGASGVGATLTAGSNAALTVDGTSVNSSDRILVKNQASALQNGVYTVTTVGDGSTPWVITRATDFDTAAEMTAGSYFLVSAGATNIGASYVLQTTVATVGSDAVTFIQFANANTGVSSLTGSDGSVTVSAPTGAVQVAVNVAHANTWTAVQTFGNSMLAKTGIPWADPRGYGAVCDGVTNDSAAFSSAVAALASGGILNVGPGTCCLSTGVSISQSVRIIGASAVATFLSACGANTDVVTLNAQRATLEHIGVLGTDSLSASQPAISLGTGCVECLVDDVYVVFGNNAISITGSDLIVRNTYAAFAYGSGVIINTGGGSWFDRVKIDQSFPTNSPPTGLTTAVPAWQAGHGYTLNQVVTTGGYIIQCTQSGTSGGSAPTVLKYSQTIVDNGAHWQLVSSNTYYGMFISGAGSQNTMSMMDFTGSFTDAIHIGGAIFSLKVTNSSFAQYFSSAIVTDFAGKVLLFSNNEVVGGILQSVGSGINIGTTWLGPVSIVGNHFVGNFWGTTQYGIVITGGANIMISNNNITGFSNGVFVAGGLFNFSIIGNNLGDSHGSGTNTTPVVVAAGANDFYFIVNNVFDGLAMSDGGTGVHKTVSPNW